MPLKSRDFKTQQDCQDRLDGTLIPAQTTLNNSRRWIVGMALVLGMLFGLGSIGMDFSARAEAGNGSRQMTLWYCDVSLTFGGKTHRGYLGGYVSKAQAQQMYNLWAKGVGPKNKPRLNRIYSETK